MAVTLLDNPGGAQPRGRAGERVRGFCSSSTGAGHRRCRRRRFRAPPEPPPPQALCGAARLQQPFTKIDQSADGGLLLRRGAGQHDRQPQSAEGPAGDRARAEGPRAGCRARAGRRARLPGNLVRALGLKNALTAHADADAVAGAHLGAGPRGRAVGALLHRSGSRRGHARGRAGRLHAAPAGGLARRAGRAHRIVQHDDRAARRSRREQESRRAMETTRAHLESMLGNLLGGRAGVRRRASAAHGQSERRGDPVAAGRRSDRHAARRLGQAPAGARAVRRASWPRLSRQRGLPVAARGAADGREPRARC